MADRVLFNDGDALSETNIASVLSRSNATDYVETGLGLSADFNADTLDIGSGEAFVDDGGQTYYLDVDQRTGLGLTASDVNHVYLTVDPGASDVEGSVAVHIDTDDSAPAGQPSLKLGTVDTASDTTTETNRDPALTARRLAHTIEDPVDESSNRSTGTVYQNDTTSVRYLIIWLENATGSAGAFDADLSVSNSSSSVQLTDKVKTAADDSDILSIGPVIVPPGAYYRVRSFGDESINQWLEADYE